MISLQTNSSREFLADRSVGAQRSFQVPLRIRAQTAIIVQLSFRGPCRSPVKGVATLLAHQHPLQQGGLGGAPWRVLFVALQLLLRERKGLFADQRGYGNLDPFLPWPLVMGAIPTRHSLALAERPGDAFPRAPLGLALAGRASISRIPQHPQTVDRSQRVFPVRVAICRSFSRRAMALMLSRCWVYSSNTRRTT